MKYKTAYRPSVAREKVRTVFQDVPRFNTSRKHWQDWEGIWHREIPKIGTKKGEWHKATAWNVPIKKVWYDIRSDTRSILLKP